MKKSRQQIIDEMLKYYGLDTKVLIENFKPNRFMGYSNRMQRIKCPRQCGNFSFIFKS